MKKYTLIYLILVNTFGFAQLSKIHYIPPITTSNNLFANAEEQYLYVSTPSINPINFKIKQLGTITIDGVVSKSNPYIYNIGSGINTQFVQNSQDIATIAVNKGFIIEAENLVYATVRINGGGSNQAGQITSKGLAGLGKIFRIGAFLNPPQGGYGSNNITFASVLATENNTIVTFSDIKPGVELLNNFSNSNATFSKTLNNGESYIIAVEGPNTANATGLIGAKISSNKDIVVNCGSTTGSNGTTNQDYGIDQLVPYKPVPFGSTETGSEYIFIKNTGQDIVEVVILVANEDTKVFLNGNLDNNNPDFTILSGQFKAFDGSFFNPTNKNLYIRTDKKIFAYQCIGDNTRPDLANQNMFFVPPLSCETPRAIDNIPQINKIGDKIFNGRITIATKTGSTLTFTVNGVDYTTSNLISIGGIVQGPFSVLGNPAHQTYSITGLSGDVSIFSSTQLYVAAFGTVGAATFGGYYSGFAFKPEISFQTPTATQLGCIPNVSLVVSSQTGYDEFKWYYNNSIVGTNNTFVPAAGQPGNYYVTATISACGTSLDSDIIPVSNCPSNSDNDLANDNVDLDFDNDGIPNCVESFGDFNLNLATPVSSTIPFTTLATATPAISGSANGVFTGNSDGSFTTSLIAKNDMLTYNLDFLQPISLELGYINFASSNNLSNSDSKFILKTNINKTITVLNPTDQLLIDTNYDGIYESGVEQYSSFEIRFKLKSITPLVAGTGTFSFRANQVTNLNFTHINLSETNSNNASFAIKAICIPKDSDGDGVFDQFDLDSDNDGILDNTELSSQNYISPSNIDLNLNGWDDAYDNNFVASNSDLDLIPDFLDLDSDNDGVYDLIESGCNAIDANNNGIIDGNSSLFGANGLLNSLETITDSGILNYTLLNYDADSLFNFVDLDSDGDDCSDLIEAAISGSNLIPNINYSISAPIIIKTQPIFVPTCLFENATISIQTNTVTSYQWEVSTNAGISWSNITNNTTYSGSTYNTLQITSISNAFNGYQYRVKLAKIGNSCGKISDATTVTILALPIISSPINLVQCDDDTDGISVFNLTQKNSFISTNSQNETFSYYKTENGAKLNTSDSTDFISNPTAYTSSNGLVYVRVQNSDGCFIVGRINLFVSVTQIDIPALKQNFDTCDDALPSDVDGFSKFDFSAMKTLVENQIPTSSSNYSIKFYPSQIDVLSELNEIINISDYKNTQPNQQDIWVRIDSTLDNACFGIGIIATLTVKALPKIELIDVEKICLNKPTEPTRLTAGILDGSPESNYSYVWKKDSSLLQFSTSTIDVVTNGIYSVEVTQNGCSRTRTITVIASDIARPNFPLIVDLVDNNSITIVINRLNFVPTPTEDFYNFEYSLDLPKGPFQLSNIFENVSPGFHDIYINDINGCGIVKQEVGVLGAPSFFTPNNDGYNDTWNIIGVEEVTNSRSVVYIYNRFGKLLKQISVLGDGWDGKINQKELPADDYWYMLQLQNGRTAKGHFSLKR
jgi:gliding motility-associated-like protein